LPGGSGEAAVGHPSDHAKVCEVIGPALLYVNPAACINDLMQADMGHEPSRAVCRCALVVCLGSVSLHVTRFHCSCSFLDKREVCRVSSLGELATQCRYFSFARCQYPQKSTDGLHFIASAATAQTCSPFRQPPVILAPRRLLCETDQIGASAGCPLHCQARRRFGRPDGLIQSLLVSTVLTQDRYGQTRKLLRDRLDAR
jgi:hypothetical protein